MTKWVRHLLVVLVVLSAGSVTYPSKSAHELDFDGRIDYTEGEFTLTGQLEVDAGTDSTQRFSEIRISLYDEEKTVIRSVSVGNLSTNPAIAPRRQPVDISVTALPAYVIVESPISGRATMPLR